MSPTASVRRRVEWMDTDAAGIWHHSVVLRWLEDAEAELHRSLGTIDETFGATPRVRTEFEFFRPVRFDDVVDIAISVVALGRTSITYQLSVETDFSPVAKGEVTAVFIDRETGESRPWTHELREALRPETEA